MNYDQSVMLKYKDEWNIQNTLYMALSNMVPSTQHPFPVLFQSDYTGPQFSSPQANNYYYPHTRSADYASSVSSRSPLSPDMNIIVV